jgi:hypothetical protein
LIFAQFEPEEVLSVFRAFEHPDANVKVGLTGYLEDACRSPVLESASGLNGSVENVNVRETVQFTLEAT